MKRRLDVALAELGLAPSRTAAQALIMAGEVKVAGQVEYKASRKVDGEALEVAAPKRFVSRGGDKLEGAFAAFDSLSAQGKICLDVGSSTGGFTDCLLQHGAKRV
ncbi:MAG: TlyA family rRNA (cytidine-2'-O)-methyltransferase, partial [Kiritimatiellae bacterium]|nr:TlyA family rRNA (cytidine-2'-O)-methyltransferase [Kiritimatiellia bacterium]